MSFHQQFAYLTDSELLSYIIEHDILPFSQYSHLVLQPLISSDGYDEIYNPESQINTLNDILTCD